MSSQVLKIAPLHKIRPGTMLTGRVVAREPLCVKSEWGVVECRRAASCLLEPALDDQVLLALTGNGRAYVLSVLERAGQGSSEIALPGDTVFRAEGRLSLTASQGIDLCGGEEVSILSSAVKVVAQRGEVAIDALNHWGASLTVMVDRIKTIAAVLESVVETASEWAKRLFRRVEECERISSRNTQYHCDELFSLDSRNTIAISEELTKIDAEQIHLG